MTAETPSGPSLLPRRPSPMPDDGGDEEWRAFLFSSSSPFLLLSNRPPCFPNARRNARKRQNPATLLLSHRSHFSLTTTTEMTNSRLPTDGKRIWRRRDECNRRRQTRGGDEGPLTSTTWLTVGDDAAHRRRISTRGA